MDTIYIKEDNKGNKYIAYSDEWKDETLANQEVNETELEQIKTMPIEWVKNLIISILWNK